MFTRGQLLFGCLFALTFILVIFFSYKKDKKVHLKNYKGSFWVLIAFIIFVSFLVLIKYFLKN